MAAPIATNSATAGVKMLGAGRGFDDLDFGMKQSSSYGSLCSGSGRLTAYTRTLAA